MPEVNNTADPVTSDKNGFTVGHDNKPYLFYTVVTRYVWDEGLVQLPVGVAPSASPGSVGQRVSCEVVRASAPFGRKEVTFHARRRGAPPVVPSPRVYETTNEVFVSSDVTVMAPSLQILLNREWEVSGVYTYILKQPIWAEDGLPSGASPADQATEDKNIYPADAFSPQLTPGGTDLQRRPS